MFEEIRDIPFSKAFENKKTVSIDYDETFNIDPILFLKVISLFQKAGFNVICCTFRYEEEKDDGFELLINAGVKCYFTGRIKKEKYLKAKGIDVDIWIDDDPSSII